MAAMAGASRAHMTRTQKEKLGHINVAAAELTFREELLLLLLLQAISTLDSSCKFLRGESSILCRVAPPGCSPHCILPRFAPSARRLCSL